MSEAYRTKLARVREMMAKSGFGTLVLSRIDNIFWLCDADTHVGLNSDAGIASVVITAETVTAVCSNIEAPRLRDEELTGLGIEVRPFDWWDGDPGAVVTALADPEEPLAADTPSGAAAQINLAPLRYALLPDEVGHYRQLGADMGEAVAQVARELQPGWTEFAVAGQLSDRLLEQGITPVVLLVAADERIARYRHPIPTGKSVDDIVMLVACGRRHGLIVALTRIVSFSPLSTDLRQRHEAVCQVDAAFIAPTVPGSQVAAIFAAGVAAYAETGYPEEWKLHHQGGATGYAGRDYKGTLNSTEVVQPWQAFAWNPSITGTKSEDTMLATPEGPEIISASPDWPLLERTAGGRRVARPDILVR
ncbi:MAG: M24 family metallopeptidase [Armatimonadetes bacterium]|nr:M24 family metallopeptidase [Armatimonadota bacterium]